MPSTLIIAIIAIVVLIDLIVFAPITRHKQRQAADGPRISKQWQWLAERYGLSVTGGEPAVPGVKLLSFLRRARDRFAAAVALLSELRGLVMYYNR